MIYTMQQFQDFTPKRDTFALFGYPLGHTMSPELHADLFQCSGVDADYIAVSVPPEALPAAFQLAKEKLRGFNCTIPHKKAIIPLLDAVDQSAKDLHSVNTVAIRDGKTTGYNTDILGFASSLTLDTIKPRGKHVLLVGYGGAAAVMGYHVLSEGARLTITGRNAEKADALRGELQMCFPNAHVQVALEGNIPDSVTIVLNATPIGMFPHEESSPLKVLPPKTKYVFDAIYNPPRTQIMLQARQNFARTRDGLNMLVMQAAWAQTHWLGTTFSAKDCDAILQELYAKMAVKRLAEKHGKTNIALCGFMGSGKTLFGKLLAKALGFTFVDADAFLEQQAGRSISEIFATNGEPYFRDLETKTLETLASRKGCVISLGGGAVLRPQNVEIIKSSCFLMHLNPSFQRIWINLEGSKHRPLLDNAAENRYAETRTLFEARKPIYQAACDVSVKIEGRKKALKSIMMSI